MASGSVVPCRQSVQRAFRALAKTRGSAPLSSQDLIRAAEDMMTDEIERDPRDATA